MSASEKLKALEVRLDELMQTPGSVDSARRLRRKICVALPRIVAVVEAAERVPELRYSNAQPSLTASWSAKNLRRALAALEEALT